MSFSRRDAISVVTGTAASLWATQGCRANAVLPPLAPSAATPKPSAAPPVPAPPYAAGSYTAAPLPFDPKSLQGISERMITSHHDNNYAGAVKNLNRVLAELAQATKDTPAFVVAGLKERELTFKNSVVLHEHYFANLGGNGKASGAIEKALADAFGGFSRWEETFRAVGASLAGGSGWVVLDWDFHANGPRVYGSGGHAQSLAFGAPLLVMDMYEHAYAIDYGAAAAKYVDAFFASIQWDEVNRRLDRAIKAAAALRA